MKHLLFVIIALLSGYGLTLLCYVMGGVFVQPSLFLARLAVDDVGGDTLLVPFTIINTVLAAIVIYVILWFMTRNRKARLVWTRRRTTPCS